MNFRIKVLSIIFLISNSFGFQAIADVYNCEAKQSGKIQSEKLGNRLKTYKSNHKIVFDTDDFKNNPEKTISITGTLQVYKSKHQLATPDIIFESPANFKYLETKEYSDHLLKFESGRMTKLLESTNVDVDKSVFRREFQFRVPDSHFHYSLSVPVVKAEGEKTIMVPGILEFAVGMPDVELECKVSKFSSSVTTDICLTQERFNSAGTVRALAGPPSEGNLIFSFSMSNENSLSVHWSNVLVISGTVATRGGGSGFVSSSYYSKPKSVRASGTYNDDTRIYNFSTEQEFPNPWKKINFATLTGITNWGDKIDLKCGNLDDPRPIDSLFTKESISIESNSQSIFTTLKAGSKIRYNVRSAKDRLWLDQIYEKNRKAEVLHDCPTKQTAQVPFLEVCGSVEFASPADGIMNSCSKLKAYDTSAKTYCDIYLLEDALLDNGGNLSLSDVDGDYLKSLTSGAKLPCANGSNCEFLRQEFYPFDK